MFLHTLADSIGVFAPSSENRVGSQKGVRVKVHLQSASATTAPPVRSPRSAGVATPTRREELAAARRAIREGLGVSAARRDAINRALVRAVRTLREGPASDHDDAPMIEVPRRAPALARIGRD